MTDTGISGGCLCGQVRYRVDGPVRSVVACHCRQCRKTSGHHVAATQVADKGLSITGDDKITWFRSSDVARRGFCQVCGSQLFWQRLGSGRTSIMAGSIDGATGLRLDRQLHTLSKGDYYDLPSVPEVDQSSL